MLDLRRVLASKPAKPDGLPLTRLITPWGERLLAGEDAGASGPTSWTAPGVGLGAGSGEGPGRGPHHGRDAGLSDHPHPLMERRSWTSLDGWWDFAVTVLPGMGEARAAWRVAEPPSALDRRIRVPFSPEAALSGVGRQTLPNELLWYRRRVAIPPMEEGDRLLLHFEAVDYACACYVNGARVGEHVGGYLPFVFDVTDVTDVADVADVTDVTDVADVTAAAAAGRGEPTPARCHLPHAGRDLEVALCVWDPSDAGVQPRGKQRLERGGIWYTAQSGIWQTVWMEVVPKERVVALELGPRADEGVLVVCADVTGEGELSIRVLDGTDGLSAAGVGAGGVVAEGVARAAGGRARLELAVESPHLWSPADPHLYRLEIAYGRDLVRSYCAFRTVTMERDAAGHLRVCLNHEPVFLRGLLDQGYWPDGLMTAPADDALARDVRMARGLGFNLLRKHIKVEPERWYYHCDRLGMLVMQDMVSGGGSPYSAWHTSYKPTFVRASWSRFVDDTPRAHEALGAADATYRREWLETCEGTVRRLRSHPCIVSWCLFNEGWGQFDARDAWKAVRALDPARPVDATSGWYDQGAGDFWSVHNYFRPLAVWHDPRAREGDGGPRAFLISEFGGLSWRVPGHSSRETSYGYGSATGAEDFSAAVRELLAQADALESQGLAGFIYTQLSDVEEETNGLVTYDRRLVKGAGRAWP